MTRLISPEDIHRQYTSSAREVGGTTGIRRRGGCWLLPKTNWEALKISQPRLNPPSHSLLLFFPPFFSSALLLSFCVARSSLFLTGCHSICLSLLCSYFHNDAPSAISSVASFSAPLDAAYFIPIVNNSLGLCLRDSLSPLLYFHYPARSNDTHIHLVLCIIVPD